MEIGSEGRVAGWRVKAQQSEAEPPLAEAVGTVEEAVGSVRAAHDERRRWWKAWEG